MAATLKPYNSEDFQRDTGVSRETLDRLTIYAEVLEQWGRRINLVGPATLADLWRRHILDSAQLAPLIPPNARTVVDLGSGAGLPGLILSILNSALTVHLVEADRRKCAFLREAARLTQATAIVHESRIEAVRIPPPDVIVARACAPLPELLELAAPMIAIHTTCLFLKGARAEQELTAARARWNMRTERVPSRSDPSGVVLVLTEISHVRFCR